MFCEYLRGHHISYDPMTHTYVVSVQTAKHAQTRFRINFLNYDQSSKCHGMRDSSVSYAAAVVTAEGEQ